MPNVPTENRPRRRRCDRGARGGLASATRQGPKRDAGEKPIPACFLAVARARLEKAIRTGRVQFDAEQLDDLRFALFPEDPAAEAEQAPALPPTA